MAGSRPDRYEKERAAWLRAGNGPLIASRMRRLDLLDRAVSRRDRGQAGLTGAAAVQSISKPSSWTATHKPGGEWRGWVKWAAVPVAAILLPSVPGIYLGRYGYRALERFAGPKLGRRMLWIGAGFAALAAIALVARLVLTDWPWFGIGGTTQGYWPWEWITVGGLVGWIQWTLVVALGTAAYQVWAWGWAGAPTPGPAAPKKRADGTWTAPSNKVEFDVDRGEEYVAPEVAEVAEVAPEVEPGGYWPGGTDEEGPR
ncbi:hypothetical protein GCM10010528_23230 [Gordonia defluvii]|uniref:Uncharacterized protein n=1 Tax=Gordonia defluvii TaxID=283718 RepID=A0ABP6LL84_9ACTN